MKTGIMISLVSLLVVLVAPAALAEAGTGSIVIVTGKGSACIAPDKIRISFSVGLLKKTSDEAADAAEKVYEQVLTSLGEIGFGPERVITGRYGVHAQRHPKNRDKYIGYSAEHMVRVSTSDPDSLGAILDQILRVEGTRIRDIVFTSTKLDSIRRVALSEAVKNVHADAAVMAEAAGGVLGDLIEITTHFPDNSTHREKNGYERISLHSTMALPTPVTPEKVSISITVLGKWRFIEEKTDKETIE